MQRKKTKAPLKKKFPVWAWVIAAAAVLLLVAFTIYQSRQQAGPAQGSLPAEISVAQVAEKRDLGAFILDVREPQEWQQFHIPGATLIPLGQLQDRLSEVPKDKEVVVVCRTGNRSAQGRDILLNAGFPQVTSMAGGVTEWQAQGLAIATGQ